MLPAFRTGISARFPARQEVSSDFKRSAFTYINTAAGGYMTEREEKSENITGENFFVYSQTSRLVEFSIA